MMAQEGPDPNVWMALSEASLMGLAPGAIEDYRVPIAWFEKRLSVTPAPRPDFRYMFSNVLGGLLLRAGRIDEAIARLNEGIAAMKELEGPGDWAFLALAHTRKGNLAEARRYGDRLRALPSDLSGAFWDLQELGLLRDEVESALSDAEFPKNPIQGSMLRF